MKKKRLLALLLCLCMIFSSALSVSAAELTGASEDTEIVQEDKQSEEESTEEETEEPAAEEGTSNPDAKPAVQAAGDDVDASVWTSADFTYTSYEKRLYGCDYSRDFVIK